MELKELLVTILRREEDCPLLQLNSAKEVSCTQPGQNFMSVVNIIEVEGTIPGGLYKKSVFLKRPPDGALQNALPNVDDAFANEVLMYNEVLPLYDGKLSCARCLYAAGDVIVLENLRARGYQTGDRHRGYDLTTTKHVLKALAKLHAASFHARIVEKDAFSAATSKLRPLTLFTSQNKNMMDACLRRVIRHLDEVEDLKEVAVYLCKLKEKLFEKMRDLRAAKNISVLCHGDFWLNNILIRDNLKDLGNASEESPEDRVRIIDLQACAVLSPAVDFWLVLYTGVSPELLTNNCEHLISLYSATFVKVLNSLSTPAEHIPSVSSLTEELVSKEFYGLLMAMIYLPALYISPAVFSILEMSSEKQRMEENFLDQFIKEGFKERFIELARWCKNRGKVL